jgi:hypothetical protein
VGGLLRQRGKQQVESMASMYLKTSLFGTAAAHSNDDELCAAATVVMLGRKW